MKNLFQKIFLFPCLLLIVGVSGVNAQTEQKGDARTAVSHKPLPAKIALKNAQAQLQKVDPNSARYADLKSKVEKLQQQEQLETQANRSEVQTRISDYQLILTKLNAKLPLLSPNSKEFVETQHAIEKVKLTIANLEKKQKTNN